MHRQFFEISNHSGLAIAERGTGATPGLVAKNAIADFGGLLKIFASPPRPVRVVKFSRATLRQKICGESLMREAPNEGQRPDRLALNSRPRKLRLAGLS